MTNQTSHPSETPVERLARSLFGFALLAALIGTSAWLALAVSPESPDVTFAQWRTLILIAFGGVVLVLIVMTGLLLRMTDAGLLRIAAPVNALLRHGIVIVIVLLALLEINLIAASALRDIAPSIVNPLRLALGGWSLVVVGIALTLHWERLRRWFGRTSSTWAGIGFGIVSLTLLGGLFALTAAIVQRTGINDRLRGGLDYREIAFIDDGAQPTSSQFWQEQSQTRVRWEPWVYWVVDGFEGQYINVNSAGVRRTINPDAAAAAPPLAVFGGSTVWGEGARDAYTIPSQLATLLAARGTPYSVTNYGQTGYVSMQDLLMFQAQLMNDRAPQVAVFYGGFNDVLSAYYQPFSGVSLQETDRLSDAEAGRALRAGQPVLRPASVALAEQDFSLIVAPASDADAIVTRYLQTVAMIATLAEQNDVTVLFVWQPALAFKETLIAGEIGAASRMNTERPGLAELYRAADGLLRERIASNNPYGVIMLSDLFDTTEAAVFYDLIHITEQGNTRVAEAIAEAINTK